MKLNELKNQKLGIIKVNHVKLYSTLLHYPGSKRANLCTGDICDAKWI